MMFARALSRAARAFASDVIGGMYETSEVVDFAEEDYIAVERDGEVYYTTDDEVKPQEAKPQEKKSKKSD